MTLGRNTFHLSKFNWKLLLKSYWKPKTSQNKFGSSVEITSAKLMEKDFIKFPKYPSNKHCMCTCICMCMCVCSCTSARAYGWMHACMNACLLSKMACLCQSIEINNNKHVYRQSQVRKPIDSEETSDKFYNTRGHIFLDAWRNIHKFKASY